MSDAIILRDQAVILAKDFLRKEAELLPVLQKMKKTNAFIEFNYTGVYDFCSRELKLSESQSYYYKRVIEAAEKVPEIITAVVQGEMNLSTARRIAPAVTKENFSEWADKSRKLSQKELEKEVTAVNPKATTKDRIRPVAKELMELKVKIDNQTEKDIQALKDILSQKLGKAAELKDVIAWATKVCREKHDPERKAARGKSRKVSSGKVAKVGRQPILLSIKSEVIRRDGHKCSEKGCANRRWLHLHHIIEVSKGGPNTAENLRLVCSAHHRRIHSEEETAAKRRFSKPLAPRYWH